MVPQGKRESKLKAHTVKNFLRSGGLASSGTYEVAKWYQGQVQNRVSEEQIQKLLQTRTGMELTEQDMAKFRDINWRYKDHVGTPDTSQRRIETIQADIQKLQATKEGWQRWAGGTDPERIRKGRLKMVETESAIRKKQGELEHQRSYLQALDRSQKGLPPGPMQGPPEPSPEPLTPAQEAAKAQRRRRKSKVKFGQIEVSDPGSQESRAILAAREAKRARTQAEADKPVTTEDIEPVSIKDIKIKPRHEREAEMRKLGMIIDPKELDFEELASYRDMRPSALSLEAWHSTLASGKSSLKKATASYKKYQKKFDQKYVDYGKDIKAKDLKKYQQRISEILDKNVVSQHTSKSWKRNFGDHLKNIFKLPDIKWYVNKHPLDPTVVEGLSRLLRRMKNFGGAKFAMDADEMLLFAKAAGMPQQMSEDYKRQKEISLQNLGVYKLGMEHLQEDVKRIGIATAAREVMDRQAVTEDHAAKARADLAKKRRAAEKRAAKKAKEAIKVQSKTLAKRGRSKSPGPATKRSRTASPPKGTKRRSASKDRGGEKRAMTRKPITSEIGAKHRPLHAHRPGVTEKSEPPPKKTRTGRTGKPSVASRPGPYD